MYYDSTETYALKVPAAWTWGGKKELFFVQLLESSFPKKDSFIYNYIHLSALSQCSG